MINLKAKDSVAESIKDIMEKKELSPKQKQIAKMSHPKDEIDAGDLSKLRAGHKPVKAKGVDEEIDPEKTVTDTLRGREKKSNNPFLSKKVFMDVPGDVHEGAMLKVDKKPHPKTWHDVDPKLGKQVDKMSQAEKVRKGLAHPDTLKKKVVAEGLGKTLKSFKEEYEENSIYDQMIQEVLSKDATAGDYIHDFVHSDNPKFAGKSKEKRKQMALAAYYAKQRNEEVDVEEDLLGKYVLTNKNKHDLELKNQKDQLKRIDAKRRFSDKLDAMADYRRKTIGLPKINEGDEDETEESANPFSSNYKSQMKAKPGEKAGFDSKRISTGTVYTKKHKPDDEKKDIKEAKRPESDTVPFVTNDGSKATPMNRVKQLAKQAMKKVKTEMLGKTGTSE